MAYLDSHGLQTLWTKIKTTFGRSLANVPQATSIRIQLKDGAATPNVLSYTDIPAASSDNAGLFLPNEKTKLLGIEEEANKYVHPTTSGNKHIPSGGSSGQILGWLADGTAVWLDAPETGVTKIVAGNNVSVSPSGGTGNVTINAVDTTYVFETTYNASTNKAATMADIAAAVAGSARYKGTLASEAAFTALANYSVGDYWVASATFVHTIGGSTITIDSGNMIFCRTSAASYAYGNFDIIQTDIESIPDSEINALN